MLLRPRVNSLGIAAFSLIQPCCTAVFNSLFYADAKLLSVDAFGRRCICRLRHSSKSITSVCLIDSNCLSPKYGKKYFSMHVMYVLYTLLPQPKSSSACSFASVAPAICANVCAFCAKPRRERNLASSYISHATAAAHSSVYWRIDSRCHLPLSMRYGHCQVGVSLRLYKTTSPSRKCTIDGAA